MINGEFCSTNKEHIQEQVDYRNKNFDSDNLFGKARFEEREYDINDNGLCWNNYGQHNEITTKNTNQCAVGSVRTMRMSIDNDTGNCISCPYYIPYEKIDNIRKERFR